MVERGQPALIHSTQLAIETESRRSLRKNYTEAPNKKNDKAEFPSRPPDALHR